MQLLGQLSAQNAQVYLLSEIKKVDYSSGDRIVFDSRDFTPSFRYWYFLFENDDDDYRYQRGRHCRSDFSMFVVFSGGCTTAPGLWYPFYGWKHKIQELSRANEVFFVFLSQVCV